MFEDDQEKSEEYYYYLRTLARKRALDQLNARILKDGGATSWHDTRLASIDEEAVQYAEDTWPTYYGPHTHTGFAKPWSSIWYHARLQPARFEIAIWQTCEGRNVLQGLATGTTSTGKKHLTLNWVERNFGPEYNRYGILQPILLAFEEYGNLLGAERLLIKNPVDPAKYTRYGYEPFTVSKSATDFLSKEMKNGLRTEEE